MLYGGRVQLAPSVLESIAGAHHLSSVPIVLKIENKSKDKVTYAGVQFNGRPDTIELPILMAEFLGR